MSKLYSILATGGYLKSTSSSKSSGAFELCGQEMRGRYLTTSPSLREAAPTGSGVTLVRPWRLPLGEDSLTLRYRNRREPPSLLASPLGRRLRPPHSYPYTHKKTPSQC
ncbi:MAG: hypothetical protein HWQ38_28850 [Nostoc sp. NMS7]|nr:hypothetical protein [Nostoc sp. NMS7]